MSKERYNRTAVWSNACFLIPLGLALSERLFVYAVMIALLMAHSFSFHHSCGTTCRRRDKFFAYILIAYNLAILSRSGASWPLLSLIACAVGIGLYFLFIRDKDDWEWHLSSAVITTLCIVAYSFKL